jgi:hypothetical protein
VALSLILSLRIDAFTLGRRRARGRTQLLNRADARSRLVKFVRAGALIPIAALVAATRLKLPDHRTPMTVALEMRLPSAAADHAEQLGKMARRAQSPALRVQGILALQALSSDEALRELLRILDEDQDALKDASEAQALSKALASYGAPARAALRLRFEAVPLTARRAEAPAPGGLFEHYLAASFDGLESEVSRTADPATRESRLSRLRAAQTELRETLRDAERDIPPGAGAALPVFLLQTFRAMSITEDASLLAFAQQVAGDSGWSDGVRGEALRLVGKLGGKNDIDGLYLYLDSPSATIQANALEAIAALQSKLATTAKGS